MLILIRRVGETVMVGDDVKITIMAVKGVKTRIGIEAPKDLPVHREEVYRLLQQEHEQAAQPGPSPQQPAAHGALFVLP